MRATVLSPGKLEITLLQTLKFADQLVIYIFNFTGKGKNADDVVEFSARGSHNDHGEARFHLDVPAGYKYKLVVSLHFLFDAPETCY